MNNNKTEAAAIIVAAGASRRFNSKTPKQFFKLGAYPVFLWSILAFKKISEIKQIVLVAPKDRLSQLAPYAKKYGFNVVSGGKERHDSVKAGLSAVKPHIRYVLIHDGARPLISGSLIKECLKETIKYKATVSAVPSTDTVKLERNGFVKETYPRQKVWLAQTPQSFYKPLIEAAYKNLKNTSITDDAQVAELYGKKVKLVMGEYTNIKITRKQDIKTAKLILNI
jgi:2-C-methyl-D-erythritol 4-phosphate cytidylyltransferase